MTISDHTVYLVFETVLIDFDCALLHEFSKEVAVLMERDIHLNSCSYAS